jgi:hypothetical protein
MHYLQPDYIFARKRDVKRLRNIGFRWPRYHDSDHQAVIGTIRTGRRRLKEYRRKWQEFLLHLPPIEQQDEMTRTFEKMKVTCKESGTTKAHWRNWMSDSTWLLIKQCTSLRRAGQLDQSEGQRMQRAIHAALKRDHAARTAQVGESIVAKLAKGNVHEAFRHLKGWYREASETQARPCFQTMERQTLERVKLYQRRNLPGPPIVIDNTEMLTEEIRDNTPTDGEIRVAVAKLTNGPSVGVSRMRAEHLKEWLKGAKLEEDPKTGPTNVGAVKEWDALVQLVQAIWDKGKIPTQLGWVVTVLIPKGGRDYRGISLLKPIWKVIERVMDKWLEAIILHDSLHGCRNGRGTGTGVIKAKLTQQLAHLNRPPSTESLST